MTRSFLLLLLILPCGFICSQNVKLKKPLSRTDFVYLQKQALENFPIESHIRVGYSNIDLVPSDDFIPDLPATPAQVKKIEKQLESSGSDSRLQMQLAGMYARLGNMQEAQGLAQKTVTQLEVYCKLHPDSAAALCTLADAYRRAGRSDDCIATYRKSIAMRPSYSRAYRDLATGYLSLNVDTAFSILKSYVNNYPDIKGPMATLTSCYIVILVNSLGTDYSTSRRNMNTDSAAAMPLIKELYDRHKTDFDIEYIYQVSRQTMLFNVIEIKYLTGDSTYTDKGMKFNLSPADKQKLLESESFFLNCLQRPVPDNHYYANKMLGNLYLFLDQPQKSIPYLKKTIELKPVSRERVNNNGGEEHDNLIVAYRTLKDSTAMEKVYEEKMRILPDVDPNPEDCINLGNLLVFRKNYKRARGQYLKAIAIDSLPSKTQSMKVEGYLGLGLLDYLEGNNKAALDHVSKAYTLDQKRWEALILYGIVLMKENDIRNAYDAFKIARSVHDREWIQKDLIDHFFSIN